MTRPPSRGSSGRPTPPAYRRCSAPCIGGTPCRRPHSDHLVTVQVARWSGIVDQAGPRSSRRTDVFTSLPVAWNAAKSCSPIRRAAAAAIAGTSSGCGMCPRVFDERPRIVAERHRVAVDLGASVAARVEIRRHVFDRGHPQVVREADVQGLHQHARRQAVSHLDACHLCPGMHAGVGAAGSDNRHGPLFDDGERLFERVLHGLRASG